MPPSASLSYGISKAEDVQAFLKGQTASQRDHINDAIDNLQTNPKPAGFMEEAFGTSKIFKVVIDTTQPPFLLVYLIDETKERVHIIAVAEKRFS